MYCSRDFFGSESACDCLIAEVIGLFHGKCRFSCSASDACFRIVRAYQKKCCCAIIDQVSNLKKEQIGICIIRSDLKVKGM